MVNFRVTVNRFHIVNIMTNHFRTFSSLLSAVLGSYFPPLHFFFAIPNSWRSIWGIEFCHLIFRAHCMLFIPWLVCSPLHRSHLPLFHNWLPIPCKLERAHKKWIISKLKSVTHTHTHTHTRIYSSSKVISACIKRLSVVEVSIQTEKDDEREGTIYTLEKLEGSEKTRPGSRE